MAKTTSSPLNIFDGLFPSWWRQNTFFNLPGNWLCACDYALVIGIKKSSGKAVLGTFLERPQAHNRRCQVSKYSVRMRSHIGNNNQSTYCKHSGNGGKGKTPVPQCFLSSPEPQQWGPGGVQCRRGNCHTAMEPLTNSSCFFLWRPRLKGNDWDWKVPSPYGEKHLCQGSWVIMRSPKDIGDVPQLRPRQGGPSAEAPGVMKQEWGWALPTWSGGVGGGREAESSLTAPSREVWGTSVLRVWHDEGSFALGGPPATAW